MTSTFTHATSETAMQSHRPEPTLNEERRSLARRLILPTQILLVFIVAFPLLMQLYISMTWWTPLDGKPWTMAYQSWVWLLNYGDLLTDKALWGAIWRTVLFVMISVPIELLLGLILAALFYEGVYARSFFYSIVLMPMMIVPAVAGYIFFLLFQQTGPVNAVLSLIYPGAPELNWLNDVNRAFVAIIIADVWQWTPLMFLILYAGMMSVPEDQMRAATILGATWWHRFRYIALPRIKAVIVIALGLRVIEAFKIFDPIFIMTSGGPGVATESLSLYLYKRTFQDLEWSYVAAIGITVLVALSVITGVIIARTSKATAAKEEAR